MSHTSKNMYAKNIENHYFSVPMAQSKNHFSSTAAELIQELNQSEDLDSCLENFNESICSFDCDPSQKQNMSHQSQGFVGSSKPEELQVYIENEELLHNINQEEKQVPNDQVTEHSSQKSMDISINYEENETNMPFLFGTKENTVFVNQEDIKPDIPIDESKAEMPMQEEPQSSQSSGEVQEEQTEQPIQAENRSFIDFNRSKRQKKKNCLGQNACEETKNIFNHIVPFIEKNIGEKWIKRLTKFQLRSNRKSLHFLNQLAEEVHTLDSKEQEDFQKDFEKLIKKDVKIWAKNHIKLNTTLVILKYADALLTVMNNPFSFDSIKNAYEVHSAHLKQQFV